MFADAETATAIDACVRLCRFSFSSDTLHLSGCCLSGNPSSSCRFSPIYSASLKKKQVYIPYLSNLKWPLGSLRSRNLGWEQAQFFFSNSFTLLDSKTWPRTSKRGARKMQPRTNKTLRYKRRCRRIPNF